MNTQQRWYAENALLRNEIKGLQSFAINVYFHGYTTLAAEALRQLAAERQVLQLREENGISDEWGD